MSMYYPDYPSIPHEDMTDDAFYGYIESEFDRLCEKDDE